MNSKIIGSGRAEANVVVKNSAFESSSFYKSSGVVLEKDPKAVVEKFQEISGIRQRRYVDSDQDAVSLGVDAALNAIKMANIDKEQIGGIILGHNFGVVKNGGNSASLIPNIAALVKNGLDIKNPYCYAVDVLFGCPGWLEALINAHRTIVVGDAKYMLVIGVEVISRILDPHDLDSMLFADGAGAVVLEASDSKSGGMIGYKTVSHCQQEIEYINMNRSYNLGRDEKILHPKIVGRLVYKYAVNEVPKIIIECMEKANLSIDDIKLFLLHQANAKMNMAMGQRLMKHYNKDLDVEKIMPVIVQNIGNSSVATIPTLLDMIMRNDLNGYKVEKGDYIVMASVGAGMHANCVIYQV